MEQTIQEGRKPLGATAASRAMEAGVGTLLRFGALTSLICTAGGLMYSSQILAAFGVNVFDYAGASDLASLGLRFAIGPVLASVLLAVFVLALGLGAAKLTRQRYMLVTAWHESHGQPWKERLVGLLEPAILGGSIGYILPLALFLSLWTTATTALPAAARAHVDRIRSAGACDHYVTWARDAWTSVPPFADQECAALVGMVGEHAVFLARKNVYVVKKSSIAAIRTAARKALR